MLTKCLRISLDSVSGAKVSPTLQRNDPEEICQTPSHPFGKRAQVSESTPSLKPFPMARCSLSRQIHEYRLDCFHRAIPISSQAYALASCDRTRWVRSVRGSLA